MTYPRIRKAVFPVAGLGTRLLPASKVIPKEMLTLVDRPLIQQVVEEAREAGIEDFIFVTSAGKNLIEDHFDQQDRLNRTLQARGKTDMLQAVRESEIGDGHLYVTRQHTPRGLGHAVWCARKLVGYEPFALLLPDVIVLNETGCLKQMVGQYNKFGGNLIATHPVPRESVGSYGVVATKDSSGRSSAIQEITGLVEKPDPEEAPSNLVITGRYILQPEVFDLLDNLKPGAGGEIQITDAIAGLIGTQPVYSCQYEGKLFDCGNKLGFLEANIAYALQRDDMRDDVMRILQNYTAGAKKPA